MKKAGIVACSLFCVAGMAAAQQAPSSAGLVGVHHCTNGFILTISKCDKLNGQDACWFKVENKGQVLVDAPGSLSGTVKMLRACNGDMSVVPQSAPPASSAPRATDPAYLAEMPSADRVKNEIKGTDATDTMARQVAVFTSLTQYVQRIKTNRSVRGPYTPDEQNILSAYSMASYQITQEYGKSHTPAEANAFQGLHWKYEMGDADQWAKQLMGNQATAAYGGALKDLATTQKAHYDEEMRTYKEATERQKEAANNPGGENDHYAKDAGSVAVRHCIESGRSEMECLQEGMKIGLNDLMGGDPLEGIAPKVPTGLRFTGVYSANGFALNFRQDMVYVVCGTLLPEPRSYTVDRSGTQVSVSIPISSPPLILSYKADGSLAGQGRTIAVAGEVPAGGGGASNPYEMQTHTTTTQRQIDAADVGNYNSDQVHQNGMEFSVDQQTTSSSWGPSATFQRPRTVPKTERCTVGTLPAGSESIKTSTILTQVLGSQASKSANSAPGLRLNGKYEAPGGLKIEFRDDSATLECGESFNSEAYTLVPENGRFVVKFDNNTGPFSLVLEADGRLTGPAAVDVAGRKIVGQDVHNFTTRTQRCAVGTLSASSQ